VLLFTEATFSYNCVSSSLVHEQYMSLNSSYELRCKGEVRQCADSNSFDSGFDDFLSDWHATCDSRISFTATTPAITSLSTTIGLDACESIYEGCARWSQKAGQCTSSYTAPVDRTSCRCQPSIVSLASVCDNGGPALCRGEASKSTTMWEQLNCPKTTGSAFVSLHDAITNLRL
jgi:hypothetical protein